MSPAPQATCALPCRWQAPLMTTAYAPDDPLSPTEREAIPVLLAQRCHPPWHGVWYQVPEQHPLQRLLRPIGGALEVAGARAPERGASTALLLRECLQLGTPCWAWSRGQWIAVLGRDGPSFRERHPGRPSATVRLAVAAVAYLHGWFREVLALGPFHRVTLAQRVFGRVAVETALQQCVAQLGPWGYVTGYGLRSCLAEALLYNESPQLEHLTTEVLERLRQATGPNRRPLYYQLAKGLAAAGVLEAPLPIAPRPQAQRPAPCATGMAPEWYEWLDRWWQTSTLGSRDHVRFHLAKTGRWLQAEHPEVVSPAQWTRDLATQYVAAVCRLRGGDYTVHSLRLPSHGQPLSPRARAGQLAAVRTFFYDCQEWGWIPRRFDASRSLALPRSISALIGTRPRVIADDLWARLLWAGLQVEEVDLPRGGPQGCQPPLHPLPYVRAVTLVWLFAGLRSDEISRLRVGCVRWQAPGQEGAGPPICLLDVPTHKTGTDFTKPVDPLVGEAIDAWQIVRPSQPQYLDRKTGERVDLLFTYRASPMARRLINQSIIPMLCRKAGIASRDVRGPITSHRARATIASQLFNSRQPMSLFELQAWLGHASPASTQHYVAITPTKLAQAYTNAGYFQRNVRAIEVLVDQDTLRQTVAAGEPWRYYDLGHGLCGYEFFEQCPHRLACARCDFYHPRPSSVAQLLEAKGNILRFLEQIPLTEEERAAADGDLVAIDRLTARLAHCPTPSGQTPAQLQRCRVSGLCPKALTDST